MLNYLNYVAAVAEAEVRKVMRDPTELFSHAVQPVLWLAAFGRVFSQVLGIPTGVLGYLDYMAPGILAQSILFSAIFYGIAVICERDLGSLILDRSLPRHAGDLSFQLERCNKAPGLYKLGIRRWSRKRD